MIHHTDNLILDYWNPYIEIHYHIQIDTKDFHIRYSYNRIDSLEFIKILINNFNLGHLSQIQNLKDFKIVWNLGRVDGLNILNLLRSLNAWNSAISASLVWIIIELLFSKIFRRLYSW